MKSRRLNGFGTLISKGDGKPWLAKWKVREKIFYRTTGERDRKKALKKLEEFTRPYREKNLERMLENIKIQLERLRSEQVKKTLPLADLWDAYEKTLWQKAIDGKTLRGYKSSITGMSRWMKRQGINDVSGITKARAEEYLKHRMKTVGSGTYNNELVNFKRVWTALAHEGWNIAEDAWASFEKIKGIPKKSSRRPLTRMEQKAILDAAKEDSDMSCLLLLGLYTGLRLGDCAQIKWQDINMEAKILNVTPQKTKRYGVSVTIPLHPELEKTLLERYRSAGRTPTGFVSEKNAKGYESGALSEHISALFGKCGIKTFLKDQDGKRKLICGFHSLRHTFVSNALDAGMNPMLVKRIVGHSNLDMTDRYYHEDEAKIREGILAISHVAQR